MSGSPFKNILVPAILVSSAAFAGLTLPFVFLPSEPITINLSPLFNGEIQPVFAKERKEIAIRYIGFSIVLSVGAGMGTTEFLRGRRSTEVLAQTQKQLSTLQHDLQEKEAQLQTLKLTHETDLAPRLRPNPPSMLSEEGSLESTSSGDPNAGSDLSEWDALSWDTAEQEPMVWHDEATQSSWDTDDPEGAIAEVYWQYPTCRITTPHYSQHRFAIQLNGEYYSLFRTRKAPEKALSIVTQLNQQGKKAIITAANQGYAVWTLEPDAQPV